MKNFVVTRTKCHFFCCKHKVLRLVNVKYNIILLIKNNIILHKNKVLRILLTETKNNKNFLLYIMHVFMKCQWFNNDSLSLYIVSYNRNIYSSLCKKKCLLTLYTLLYNVNIHFYLYIFLYNKNICYYNISSYIIINIVIIHLLV